MNLLDKEILLVDKPAGLSSFAAVARIRRILTEQIHENANSGANTSNSLPKRAKVGHAGTLDPFATGLLILLLQKGTKKAGNFLKLDKSYEATIKLGEVSSTGDIEGEITRYQRESDVEIVPEIEQVQAVVSSFQGEIMQEVPAFSAVKINGQRAYKLAREGKKVEMPVREVQIYKIEVLDYQWPFLRITCDVSSGTYIRQLGIDIGKKLGVGAYLTELRRTRIGEFSITDALQLSDLGILD